MCGISGYFSRLENRDFSVELHDSLESQKYRGPDDKGSWINNKAGLSHARLAIIDLSKNGHQPMTHSGTGLHIVFNGEIYNFQDLKVELQNKGIQFSSDSDTELVLRGFEYWGRSIFTKLNGMFALAIYNEQKEELLLARDRFGIKPLYYSLDENNCFFASELGPLLKFPIKRVIDHSSLHEYFQFGYIPNNKSIIDDVSQLNQGSYIIIGKNKVEEKTYYSINTSAIDIGYNEAQKEIKSLLEGSVKRRLLADVPVATFLSSGLDSSIVTSIASKFDPGILAFSAGFSEFPYFDEAKMAAEFGKELNIKHTIIDLKKDDLLTSIDTLINSFSEPFADSSSIATFLLSQHVSKDVKVVLSGDGADELFGGYRKHKAEWLMRKYPVLKDLASEMAMIFNLREGNRNSSLGNRKRQLEKWVKASKLSNEERYLLWASQASDKETSLLLNRNEGRVSSLLKLNSINDVLLEDMSRVLSGDMLYKVDRTSMYHGLEVRLPFLDHNLVDFVFSLPSEWKLKNGKRKALLRSGFKGQLPKEIRNRKKRGFEVPIADWLKGPLKERVNSDLNEELIRDQGILNYSYVEEVIKRSRQNNSGNAPYLVWALLVFQNWVNKYNPILS